MSLIRTGTETNDVVFTRCLCIPPLPQYSDSVFWDAGWELPDIPLHIFISEPSTYYPQLLWYQWDYIAIISIYITVSYIFGPSNSRNQDNGFWNQNNQNIFKTVKVKWPHWFWIVVHVTLLSQWIIKERKLYTGQEIEW